MQTVPLSVTMLVTPPFGASSKKPLLGLIANHHLKWWLLTLGNNWERRVEHVGAKKTYNPEGVIII